MRPSIDAGNFVVLARGLQWLLGLCAGWLILEPFVVERRLPAIDIGTPAASSVSTLPTIQSRLSLSDLEGVWTRPLRQTLVEPKPKEVPPEKPPPPPPPVALPRLVATFVEGGQSWGLFIDGKGNQRVRAASQRIDDFDIEAIEPGVVKLKRGEKLFDVRVASKFMNGEQGKRRTSKQ